MYSVEAMLEANCDDRCLHPHFTPYFGFLRIFPSSAVGRMLSPAKHRISRMNPKQSLVGAECGRYQGGWYLEVQKSPEPS